MATAKKASTATKALATKKTSTAKRLTPKPEVLRELYLLSGNNCAMSDCDNVIIDHRGVVVGHVCHIEAAMPDGARFNSAQSNEDRRALGNLVLMCAGHHAQIDSKKHEATWPVSVLKKIKANHEKKFKGLDNSLKQAFDNGYVDSTDSLAPTVSTSFAELERLLPDTKLAATQAQQRSREVCDFVGKLSKVPEDERKFMASIIHRAMKLRDDGRVCVHVNDVKSAFNIGHSRIKSLGDALERYGVGSVDLASVGERDEHHVMLYEPSDYLTWADIACFCEKSGHDLDEFLLRIKFSLLG